ncbi:MAG: von Willebrand factor type A domain-containing protein, partial [Planctomycetota bacterium]|nr:von Willebrand factor type A domain-containing protein [Planctomycetota bacterium]
KGPRLAWYRHPGLQVAAAAVVAVVAFRSLDQRLLEDGFGVRSDHASRNDLASAEGTWAKDAGQPGGRVRSSFERGLAASHDDVLPETNKAAGSLAERPSTLGRTAPLEESTLEAKRRAGTTGGLETRHAEASSAGQMPIKVAPTGAKPTGGYNAEPKAASPGGSPIDLDTALLVAGDPSAGITFDQGFAADLKAEAESLGYVGGVTVTKEAPRLELGTVTDEQLATLGALGYVDSAGATFGVDHRGLGVGGGGGGAAASPPPSETGNADWFLGQGTAGFYPPATAEKAKLGHLGQSPGAAAPTSGRPTVNVAQTGDMIVKRDKIFGDTEFAFGLEADEALLKRKLYKYAELLDGGDLTVDDLLVRAKAIDAHDPETQPEQYLRARAQGLIEEVDSLKLALGDEANLQDSLVVREAIVARVQELEDHGVVGGLSDDAEEADEDQHSELTLLRGYLDDVELVEELERKRVQRQRVEVEQEYERIITRCVPRQAEKPSMMYFRYWGDNGYEFPVHDALSTFAVDVDTASYTLARRYLKEGYLPERAQIRTEEFVNYFTPDLAAPTDGEVFAVSMELAPSPFGPNADSGGDHKLLRVGVRGMEIDKSERDPLALTFVVDVSGSMKEENRLELVKHSLRLLMAELHPSDQVAIITFNNDSRRVLDMTSAGNTAAVESALYAMHADGGTNAEAGLRLGYEEAVLAHTPGAINRVVFLSDGVGNIGETNENQLLADVKRAREKGIYLNTIGVGMGNHNDRFLEQLANGGDGLCNYIDGPEEAYRALVENFTGAFQPIARDVKLQVEFDKAQVASYRLLGYENRAIADADFRNDKVDAGELGAGHQVVALYELVLLGSPSASEEPLAVARVRYKQPFGKLEAGAEDSALELEHGFWLNEQQGTFEGASLGFQKSALAAQFAEFLRRSSHARDDSVSLLRYKLEELAKLTGDPEVVELSALVQLAQPKLEPALLAAKQHKSPLQDAADELHTFEYDNLRRVYTGASLDEDLTTQLEAQREALKQRLRTELYVANGIDPAAELPSLVPDSEVGSTPR